MQTPQSYHSVAHWTRKSYKLEYFKRIILIKILLLVVFPGLWLHDKIMRILVISKYISSYYCEWKCLHICLISPIHDNTGCNITKRKQLIYLFS